MLRVGYGKNLRLRNTLELSVKFSFVIYDLSLSKLLLLFYAYENFKKFIVCSLTYLEHCVKF